MRFEKTAIVFGLVIGAAALRASFAEDSADEAFDSAAVKELAARADDLKIDDEIALLKRVQRSLDGKLLTPSKEAWNGFESLRNRTDAGLARILERGVGRGIVSVREGGAYWSFTKRSNDYDKSPQIELQKGTFGTGFYGSNGGIVVKLERASLVSMTESGVPDDLLATAEEVCTTGRKARGERPKAEVGGVYAVRAVMWDDCDVLAAFQVVSTDSYGATIAWRILRTYDVPKRKR